MQIPGQQEGANLVGNKGGPEQHSGQLANAEEMNKDRHESQSKMFGQQSCNKEAHQLHATNITAGGTVIEHGQELINKNQEEAAETSNEKGGVQLLVESEYSNNGKQLMQRLRIKGK